MRRSKNSPRRKTSSNADYNDVAREVDTAFLPLMPPPDLSISDWADQNRMLSSESSPEPFEWRTSRAEYQRGIMDAFNDPRHRRVIFMKSTQVGATSIIENVIGYYVDQEPSPILVVEPTLELSETLSKDRIAPMIRDTRALTQRFSGDRENTLLHKPFLGGHLTMGGANSPASLASRPIRVLLMDEIDRYPPSAGSEGNPVRLGMKRTSNFYNRRIGLFSTPTDAEVGIHAEWLQSDQRRFFVQCEACEHEQVLQWKNVKWTQTDGSDAHYQCDKCRSTIDEVMRDRMVTKGRWRATAKFTGVAGFHINELYSPWRTFAQIVTDYLESKDEPEKLRVWVNTSLGEPWQQRTEGINIDAISSEKGARIGEIPRDAYVLTLGVDTQGDRLALQLLAWGRNLEQWVVDYVELPGSPHDDATWDQLTEYRRRKWDHLLGGILKIAMTAIDSGGHHSQRVVAYARSFRNENVIAVKGASIQLPMMLRGRPGRVDYHINGQVYKREGEVWLVGTDVAKSFIMSRMQSESTTRRIHFAEGLTTDYFSQLTAEVYDKRNKKWVNPRKHRNEALDTMVYACAAIQHPRLRLDVATEQRWLKLEKAVTVEKQEHEEVKIEEQRPPPVQQRVRASRFTRSKFIMR